MRPDPQLQELIDTCRLELARLQDVAREFTRSNATSEQFLAMASKLEEGACLRLLEKEAEARRLAEQVSDPVAARLLLELAESYRMLAK